MTAVIWSMERIKLRNETTNLSIDKVYCCYFDEGNLQVSQMLLIVVDPRIQRIIVLATEETTVATTCQP